MINFSSVGFKVLFLTFKAFQCHLMVALEEKRGDQQNHWETSAAKHECLYKMSNPFSTSESNLFLIAYICKTFMAHGRILQGFTSYGNFLTKH